MNRESRKQLRSCFGTKEYSKKHKICKKCQHQKACEKENRTEYPSLEPPYHPRWHKVRKKYRDKFITKE